MGHAVFTGLSKIFVRQIYAKGRVSLKDILAHTLKHRRLLKGTYGGFDELPEEIALALEQIAYYLHGKHKKKHQGAATSVIVPAELSPTQAVVFKKWVNKANDSLTLEEAEILDTICWAYAPGWRKEYPDNIPLLTYFTC